MNKIRSVKIVKALNGRGIEIETQEIKRFGHETD